jgi:threonine/homoserine/homoserine lactone efflux protein
MVASAPSPSQHHTFAQALTTCLLNPKAYVFTLTILPQFIRVAAGKPLNQIAVLWVVIAATQFVIDGAIALLAHQAAPWLRRDPRVQRYVTRVVGSILVLIATTMPLYGWRGGQPPASTL